MDAGREPAKLWFHCLMAIVLAGQMVFLDSGDATRSAAAEVTQLSFLFCLSMSAEAEC